MWWTGHPCAARGAKPGLALLKRFAAINAENFLWLAVDMSVFFFSFSSTLFGRLSSVKSVEWLARLSAQIERDKQTSTGFIPNGLRACQSPGFFFIFLTCHTRS